MKCIGLGIKDCEQMASYGKLCIGCYIKELKSERERECIWGKHGGMEYTFNRWDTGCGHKFYFNDEENPLSLGMKYCCFCRGNINEVEWFKKEKHLIISSAKK